MTTTLLYNFPFSHDIQTEDEHHITCRFAADPDLITVNKERLKGAVKEFVARLLFGIVLILKHVNII